MNQTDINPDTPGEAPYPPAELSAITGTQIKAKPRRHANRQGRSPLIGVTTNTSKDTPGYQLNQGYARGIEQAGGIPIPLCYELNLRHLVELIDQLDGIVLTGGNDLDPSLYGQEPDISIDLVHPRRQTFEMTLIEEAEQRKLPVLGICLGSQVINVSRGGTLHQHIPDLPRPDALEHRQLGDPGRRHDVVITPGTRLHKIIGRQSLTVNTSHHQASDRLGRGLVACAYATDGVLEAFEDTSYPFLLAIQWHPERLLDEPEHLRLFEALIQAARQGR